MNVDKVMLVSHDAHPLMVTGAEKALLMLASACQDLQIRVIWISPKAGLSCERAIQMGMDAKVVPFPLLWCLIHEPSRLSSELNRLQQAADESQLAQLITKDSPDLMVSNSVINALPPLLAKREKIPVWWYIHEVIPNRDGLEPIAHFIDSHSERILVPSQAVKSSISRISESRCPIELLPYGADVPSCSSVKSKRQAIRRLHGWTEDHVVIGWFGTIYFGKGLLELIRASTHLKQEGKTIVILAAGNVVDPGYFEICRKEADCIDSIKFCYLGVLPRIEEILPAVDMVIVPSLVEEAFPNVVLEAMAFGKSVVAYETGGIKEIVVHGKTGYLGQKGDINGLSCLIQDLIRMPDKREKLGIKGRERIIAQFGMHAFKDRIRQMIERLAN